MKELMNELESLKYPANQSNLFLLQPIQKNYEKLSDSNKNAAFSTEPFPFFGPAGAWLRAPPSIQVQGDAPPAVRIETAWGFNGIKVELFADL